LTASATRAASASRWRTSRRCWRPAEARWRRVGGVSGEGSCAMAAAGSSTCDALACAKAAPARWGLVLLSFSTTIS
jgi:hypothetical protein